jgi:alpha-glucosidase
MDDWWRGATIYQIYPRSFQDDDGDGLGDLPGILRRLDHVASLGVEAIWLSPVFPSPMLDMGYDVSDYCGIDPVFGTLADFDRLVDRAHRLGLRVIIDLVLSHTSDRHPWFLESRGSTGNPKADWYVWADPRPDGAPPNNWLSVFGGGAWQWEARRRQYYLHNFLAEQPDLNFHNPEVQDAMLDVIRFWLERGVDGFRLDTVNFYTHDAALRDNPPARADWGGAPPVNPFDMQEHVFSRGRPENLAFVERMRALTDGFEARMLLGEIAESGDRALELMADYTRGDGRLHMAYSFDMLGPELTAAHIRHEVETFFGRAPDGWPCWSFSNHDVRRHVSRWAAPGEEEALARLAIAILASLPGTICLYQGEELGQTETELAYDELADPPGLRFWPENKGRDGCRTPMVWDAAAPNAGFSTAKPWLPVKPPQAVRAVDRQEAEPDSVLAAYRRTLALRRARPALRIGTVRFLDLPEPLLGFVRRHGGAATLCLFNLGRETQAVSLPGIAPGIPPGALAATGPSRSVRTEGAQVTLGPLGFAWFEAGPAEDGDEAAAAD